MLYASTHRFATFVECLAYFRPDPAIVAEYAAIAGSDGDEEPPPAAHVPLAWIEARCVGTATLTGDYVDIGHHETLAALRTALAPRVAHHGLRELDAAAIRLTVPRAFTREISRYVFDETVDGTRRWNGVAYRSKHGDDLENWAIFEPHHPPRGCRPLSQRSPLSCRAWVSSSKWAAPQLWIFSILLTCPADGTNDSSSSPRTVMGTSPPRMRSRSGR